MGRNFIITAASILAFATSIPAEGQEKTLTVMSYNVRNSMGMDEVRDIVSFNVVEAPQESDHRPIVAGLRTR